MAFQGFCLPPSWKTLTQLYQTLSNVKDTNCLLSMLSRVYETSGQYHDVSVDRLFCPFNGLKVFLDEIATERERKRFFQTVLPVICCLASQLDSYASIPGTQQASCNPNSSKEKISKHFMACFFASCCLCIVPLEKASLNNATDFTTLYKNILISDLREESAARLRSIFNFFENIESKRIDLKGEVLLEKKAAIKSSLPNIDYWKNDNSILCQLDIVDKHKPKRHQFSASFMGINKISNIDVETFALTVITQIFEDNEVLFIKAKAAIDQEQRFIGRQLSHSNLCVEVILTYLNRALMCFDTEQTKCAFHYVQQDTCTIKKKDTKPKEQKDANGNIPISGIQSFCDLVVDQAYSLACDEIDCNDSTSSDERCDTFNIIMRKSIQEVFFNESNAQKLYSDQIGVYLNSKEHGFSAKESNPLSIPADKRLGTSDIDNLSPLVELGSKGFADSLSESLMSCVLLSTSIATSIATDVIDTSSITCALELFQNRRKSLQEQNKCAISVTKSLETDWSSQETDYCDHNLKKDEHSLYCLPQIRKNGNDVDTGDLTSDASSIVSEEEDDERRKSLNELALSLFENFASMLSKSIIQSAVVNTSNPCQGPIEPGNAHPSETMFCNNDDDVADVDVSDDEPGMTMFSDSDSDLSFNDFDDMDRQLEDKLYSLDLIDSEERYDMEQHQTPLGHLRSIDTKKNNDTGPYQLPLHMNGLKSMDNQRSNGLEHFRPYSAEHKKTNDFGPCQQLSEVTDLSLIDNDESKELGAHRPLPAMPVFKLIDTKEGNDFGVCEQLSGASGLSSIDNEEKSELRPLQPILNMANDIALNILNTALPIVTNQITTECTISEAESERSIDVLKDDLDRNLDCEQNGPSMQYFLRNAELSATSLELAQETQGIIKNRLLDYSTIENDRPSLQDNSKLEVASSRSLETFEIGSETNPLDDNSTIEYETDVYEPNIDINGIDKLAFEISRNIFKDANGLDLNADIEDNSTIEYETVNQMDIEGIEKLAFGISTTILSESSKISLLQTPETCRSIVYENKGSSVVKENKDCSNTYQNEDSSIVYEINDNSIVYENKDSTFVYQNKGSAIDLNHPCYGTKVAERLSSDIYENSRGDQAHKLEMPSDYHFEDGSSIEYEDMGDSLLQDISLIENLATDISENILQGALSDTTYRNESIQNTNELNDSCKRNETHPGIIQYADVLSRSLVHSGMTCAQPHEQSDHDGNSMVSIDVQLEVILQWVAATVAGCSLVTFHPNDDTRLDELCQVQETLSMNQVRVRDVMEVVLRYIQGDKNRKSDLFGLLLLTFCQERY